MVTATFPVFVIVTGFDGLGLPTVTLPNTNELGEIVSTPASSVFPYKATLCGLPVALSLMITKAVRSALTVGAKTMVIVQLPPAGTELPQLLLCEKSENAGPTTLTLEIFKVKCRCFAA